LTNIGDSVEGRTSAPAGAPAGSPLSNRAAYLALGLILTVVFLAYLDTLWFQFVYDDRYQILGNPWLRSWKYVPRYFTADVWAFLHPGFRSTFYRPVFLLWFRLQYLAFGLHPWGWHFCTLLCHLGVTWLVYLTADRLLRDRLAALFAALIFGLHPIHAEAVAWVSGVTEPLFVLFLLGSFLCYLEKRHRPAQAHIFLAASLALYALAALSKETAVILPCIIFACEWLWAEPSAPAGWKAWSRDALRALAVVAPYLALFAIYIVARLLGLHAFLVSMEPHSFLSMVLTWPSVLWLYLRHLVWPVALSPAYSWEFYTRVDVRHVLLPAVLVLAAATVLAALAMRSRQAAVAIIWMVVPILPVLDLRAFTGGHFVHDRYLYLPSFGFALLVAMGLRRLRVGPTLLSGQPAVQLGLAAVLALAMGAEMVQATACYADDPTFYSYVASSRNGYATESDLAALLGQQGHLDEAIKIYNQILSTQPETWEANYNLGYAYYLRNRFPEADRYLSRATQFDATRADAYFYLGLTKLKLGQIDAAAANVQRAVSIQPDGVHYHFALGVILKLQGNLAAALAEFEQEMDLDPTDASARQQAEEIKAIQRQQH
jgi:Tfp pilus assembly protein PilF